MFFLSEKGSRKLFYTLLLFGKHRKFGQTKINFRVNGKITHLASKTISDFILPSDQLHSSHTLSSFSHTLLTDTLQAQLWSSSTEQDRPNGEFPQTELQSADPQSADPHSGKYTPEERELKHTPPEEPKHILAGQIAILVQTHPRRWCPKPPLDTRPRCRMQATLPTHPLSLSSADPSPSSSSPTHLHQPIPRLNQPIPSNQVLWTEKSPPNTDRSLVISFLSPLKLIVNTKHKSEIDSISTSLDLPLSFPQSLTLSSSPSLFDRVWKFNGFILIFVSLKSLYLAIFYYKFVWKLRKWLRNVKNL